MGVAVATGSTDPEDDDLSYEWDFGDGTANSTAPDPTHLYTGAGVFTARLTVDDGFNRFPNTTVTISVGGNKAPVPSISAPTDESKYQGGATVQLAGSATDDGPPSEVDLSWQVLLHHNTHLHEVATPEGAAAAFATYVDHDADSYYEVILTASDSEGGSATRRIQIRPEDQSTSPWRALPAGAPILYSGQGPFAAPTQRSAAVGYQATVEAPNLFVFDGRSYEFDRWSDGGGRKHVAERAGLRLDVDRLGTGGRFRQKRRSRPARQRLPRTPVRPSPSPQTIPRRGSSAASTKARTSPAHPRSRRIP